MPFCSFSLPSPWEAFQLPTSAFNMSKKWIGVMLLFLAVFLSQIIAYTSGEYYLLSILTLKYCSKHIMNKFYLQRPSGSGSSSYWQNKFYKQILTSILRRRFYLFLVFWARKDYSNSDAFRTVLVVDRSLSFSVPSLIAAVI